MEQKELKIGDVVVFIDEYREERKALVTCIHGDPLGRTTKQSGKDWVPDDDTVGSYWPCVNLLTLSSNESCKDQYGRQAERHSSVVHVSNSSAQAWCYRFVGEEIDPSQRSSSIS